MIEGFLPYYIYKKYKEYKENQKRNNEKEELQNTMRKFQRRLEYLKEMQIATKTSKYHASQCFENIVKAKNSFKTGGCVYKNEPLGDYSYLFDITEKLNEFSTNLEGLNTELENEINFIESRIKQIQSLMEKL